MARNNKSRTVGEATKKHAQREEWSRIRCWLKPRAWAVPGMTDKRWLGAKRRIQQTLRDEGYESAVRAAETTLHRARTEKRESQP